MGGVRRSGGFRSRAGVGLVLVIFRSVCIVVGIDIRVGVDSGMGIGVGGRIILIRMLILSVIRIRIGGECVLCGLLICLWVGGVGNGGGFWIDSDGSIRRCACSG